MKKNNYIFITLLSIILTGCFAARNKKEVYSQVKIRYSPDYVANKNSSLKIDGEYVSNDKDRPEILRFWPDGTVLEESLWRDLWGLYQIEDSLIKLQFYYLHSPYHYYDIGEGIYTILNDSTFIGAKYPTNDTVVFNFRKVEKMPRPNSPLKHRKWLNKEQ